MRNLKLCVLCFTLCTAIAGLVIVSASPDIDCKDCPHADPCVAYEGQYFGSCVDNCIECCSDLYWDWHDGVCAFRYRECLDTIGDECYCLQEQTCCIECGIDQKFACEEACNP
jgi:hypothetical protein